MKSVLDWILLVIVVAWAVGLERVSGGVVLGTGFVWAVYQLVALAYNQAQMTKFMNRR